jgi:hypothetical protein
MSFDKPIGFVVFDYDWIFLILVTLINAFILKARSSKVVCKHPELRDGYNQVFIGYLVFLNIPWVVMAIGMLVGGVPSSFSYLRPREGNAFVIAFHVTIVILWLLSIWWVYFKGGAEFLVKYKGVISRDIQSPTTIKFYFGLALLGGIFGMIYMWSW